MERPIAALIPPQYHRTQPFAMFVECLQRSAAGLSLPSVAPTPTFIAAGRARTEAEGEKLLQA